MIPDDSDNPFIRYRRLLDSYRRAVERGLSDGWFLETVARLDDLVAGVDHRGFVRTPVSSQPELIAGRDVWIKDETNNVGGSHKARHLFGLLLHQAVEIELGGDDEADLAIASCGNAAIGASVVAKAAGRRLRVFIPERADEVTADLIASFGSDITRCPRVEGEAGDPCYHRFQEAVAEGAVPFSVQSPDAPYTIDGGRTIGFELAEQLAEQTGFPARLDRIFVQIGGGALATGCIQGLQRGVAEGWLTQAPALHPVQTQNAHPLNRAYDRLLAEVQRHEAMTLARSEPDRFMWAWEDEPQSLADGILDDVTYDWLGVLDGVFDTGGWPVLISEAQVAEAHARVSDVTGIAASYTGTAGFAGLLAAEADLPAGERIAILITGVERS